MDPMVKPWDDDGESGGAACFVGEVVFVSSSNTF